MHYFGKNIGHAWNRVPRAARSSRMHELTSKLQKCSTNIFYDHTFEMVWYKLTIFFVCLAFDFCRFCVVIRLFHPRHNGQWPPTSKDFLSQILSITFICFYLHFILILEKEPVCSPLECSVLNKGTTGTIIITSLVWRGPWLGIKLGTSRTRSQHYTTRLSRKR